MIRIVFRFDDPSETSHRGVEQGIIEALRMHKACATFACIPFRYVEGALLPISCNRAMPLVEAANDGTIEVALHGHSHRCYTEEPALPSEFTTRPAKEQASLIQEGSSLLSEVFGQRPIGFVPPWNTFDDTTIGILEAAGFEYLSAGAEHAGRQHSVLKQLHRTSHLSQIDAVTRECVRFRHLNYTAIFVMHHYDFRESGAKQAIIDLEGFQGILAQLKSISDLQVITLQELAKTLQRTNTERSMQYRLAKKRVLRRLLPHHGFVDSGLLRCLVGSLSHGD